MEKSSENSEKAKFLKAESFLAEMFGKLEDDYSPDSIHIESCSELAGEVAQIIKEEGGSPKLVTIRGRVIEGSINRETLVPKRYEGRVKWGAHMVCVNGGLIYDPLVGVPMEEVTYKNTVFASPVEMTTTRES